MTRFGLLLVLVVVPAAHAQDVDRQPPVGSPVLMKTIEFQFPTQNNRPQREMVTYVRAVNVLDFVSLPGRNRWVVYDEAEPVILGAAERLWKSGQYESVWVDVRDEPWANGVAGRHVIFNFVDHADTDIPTADYPTPPPEYRQPPTEHERLYPPPGS